MMYNDILSNIKTNSQLDEWTSEIDILLEDLFKTRTFEESLNSISSSRSEILKDALIKNGINFTNLAGIKEYLEGLKKETENLKEVKLTLSFDPTEKSIENIYYWISQNLGIGYILDISVNKDIIGGAIIEFEGKYEDLSLKKRFEEIFGSKKQEILKVLE